MSYRYTMHDYAEMLALEAANARGEMENPAYRKRHEHDADLLAMRERRIEMMDELRQRCLVRVEYEKRDAVA